MFLSIKRMVLLDCTSSHTTPRT